MNVVNLRSLAITIDNLNEAFFNSDKLPNDERQQVADWIVGLHGQPHAYANMFAPTAQDFKQGIRLFTGERIKSGAAIGHILGEEACRMLILLKDKSKRVKHALEEATEGMWLALQGTGRPYGMYCCCTCTPALWRHLAVGGLHDQEALLNAGIKVLKTCRDGTGRWKTFPFYYTLLTLNEIYLPSARDELRHTAPVLERYAKRSASGDKYQQRRKTLAKRILNRI